MGNAPGVLDTSGLTRSGIVCLEELVQIAVLAHETQVAAEWLVVTATTCVEAHFDRIINTLIMLSKIEDNSFGRSLLNDNYDDIFKSWDSRLKCLGQGFGVMLAGDQHVQDYRTLVDLRNAVVH